MLGAFRSFDLEISRNFLVPLWERHAVDVFAILDIHDAESNALAALAEDVCPVLVEFYNTTLPQLSLNGIKGKYIWRLNQFRRFNACRDRVLEHEALGSFEYEWIIRTRPDLW